MGFLFCPTFKFFAFFSHLFVFLKRQKNPHNFFRKIKSRDFNFFFFFNSLSLFVHWQNKTTDKENPAVCHSPPPETHSNSWARLNCWNFNHVQNKIERFEMWSVVKRVLVISSLNRDTVCISTSARFVNGGNGRGKRAANLNESSQTSRADAISTR